MREKNQGITLIALIITIIIMLILVAVSIQIAINSGLFETAKNAKIKTEQAYENEANLGNEVNINGKIYNSVEEYVGKINVIYFTVGDKEYEAYTGETWLEWYERNKDTGIIVGEATFLNSAYEEKNSTSDLIRMWNAKIGWSTSDVLNIQHWNGEIIDGESYCTRGYQ